MGHDIKLFIDIEEGWYNRPGEGSSPLVGKVDTSQYLKPGRLESFSSYQVAQDSSIMKIMHHIDTEKLFHCLGGWSLLSLRINSSQST